MPQQLNTINRRFADVVQKYPDLPALSSKPHGSKTWQTLTYRDVAAQVKRFSLGLRALGIERADRVAILSDNRPEWAITDFAALAAGAVTVPVYPSLPAVQVAHILADSGARAVIAADAKQLKKLLEIREQCPELSQLLLPWIPMPLAAMSFLLKRSCSAEMKRPGAWPRVLKPCVIVLRPMS